MFEFYKGQRVRMAKLPVAPYSWEEVGLTGTVVDVYRAAMFVQFPGHEEQLYDPKSGIIAPAEMENV